MLVKAIRPGYYDLKRRREGDVFELKEIKGFKRVGEKLEKYTITPEQQFTDTWMEKVDGDEDERPQRELSQLKSRKSLRDAGREVI